VIQQTESVFSYCGWYRRGRGRWHQCCRAATEEACLAELINRAPVGTDKLVRQGNADPNRDGKQRK
jgi:hypothetical protein